MNWFKSYWWSAYWWATYWQSGPAVSGEAGVFSERRVVCDSRVHGGRVMRRS